MALWLNWIEYLTTDQEVKGSNPFRVTNFFSPFYAFLQSHIYDDGSVEKKISYKIKAPTFVDALSVAPPTGLISNHLLKDLHDFHLLYKEIQAYQKLPSLN